jgi:hypothetical protein
VIASIASLSYRFNLQSGAYGFSAIVLDSFFCGLLQKLQVLPPTGAKSRVSDVSMDVLFSKQAGMSQALPIFDNRSAAAARVSSFLQTANRAKYRPSCLSES